MTDLSSYTDADLEKELRELTGRIAKAIERREDIIDEMMRRGWSTARSLTGFRVMAHRLAEELGVPVPEIPEVLPVRHRDESWWWTNVQSTALLIKAFLPKEK